MSELRASDLHVSSSPVRQFGVDVSMPVACPNCRQPGCVTLENLGHMLYCRHCGDKFWLGRNGQWNSVQQSAKAQIKCPRCQTPNDYPVAIGLTSVACRSCHFEIPLVPLEPSPATEKPHAQRHAKKDSVLRHTFVFPLPPHYWGWAAGATLLLLVAGWWIRTPSTDPRLAAAVKQFMAALVNGDMAAASEQVVAEQSAEFQRWLKVEYSASLERKGITSNPTLELETKALDDKSTLVTVALTNASAKPIRFVQIWKRCGSDWRFAPGETRRHIEATWAEEWRQSDFSR